MKPTQKQLERIGRMTAHDQEYIDLYGAVCGMDEAGRGPLARSEERRVGKEC